MKRNRRNNTKKERTIMIASSVFVLSALTMTGIYMKSNNVQEQDDGYTIDFTALENNVEDKYQEIAQNDPAEDNAEMPGKDLAQGDDEMPGGTLAEGSGNMEDDLDYLPMEVGSGMVTIPGLTDGLAEDTSKAKTGTSASDGSASSTDGSVSASDGSVSASDGDTAAADGNASATEGSAAGQNEGSGASEDGQEAQDGDNGSGAAEGPVLHFAETEGLLRPVSGEVLIPFSMDRSVYFSTLDQFKYNSGLMIAATQGSAVAACADGRVTNIFENEELGHCVTMDLGDGYEITYGQLEEIRVSLDSYVESGETIAFVAAPTKYYSLEGSNLYLKLTADGTPVNPETLLH